MSLVGPRAALPNELERYELWHKRKLSVQPGLTCLWQIQGSETESLVLMTWVRMDLEYIDKRSLWLDFKIILRTVWVVIFWNRLINELLCDRSGQLDGMLQWRRLFSSPKNGGYFMTTTPTLAVCQDCLGGQTDKNSVRLGKIRDFSLYQCSTCHLVYVYPKPTKPELDDLYATYHVETDQWQLSDKGETCLFRSVLAEIAARSGLGEILDIGATRPFSGNSTRNGFSRERAGSCIRTLSL